MSGFYVMEIYRLEIAEKTVATQVFKFFKSGFAEVYIKQKCRASGCKSFVADPISFQKIFACLIQGQRRKTLSDCLSLFEKLVCWKFIMPA